MNVSFFDVEKNIIYLAIPRLDEYKRDAQNHYLLLLHKLIHEEVHAVSKSQCYGVVSKDQPSEGVAVKDSQFTKRNGLLEIQQGQIPKVHFSAIDEGINEMITLEVFQHLLETMRTKETKPHDITDEQIVTYKTRAKNEEFMYSRHIKLVTLLIQKIHEQTGVSLQIVWDGIKKAKLEGGQFDTPEHRELFDSSTYSGFFDQLKVAQSSGDIERLIQSVQDNVMTPTA